MARPPRSDRSRRAPGSAGGASGRRGPPAPPRPKPVGAAAGVALSRLDGSDIAPDEIPLGDVRGVFGVRGEVRLFLHHRESSLLDDPRDVVLVAPDGARYAARLSARPGAGQRVLGRIDGVDTPEQAAAMVGFELVIARSALPPLKPGEYYHADVLGASVRVEGGPVVGRVVHIHATAAHDVLEIDVGRAEPAFVLMRPDTVLAVDPEARELRIAPGLLDEDDAPGGSAGSGA